MLKRLTTADIPALLILENASFNTDQLTRESLHGFFARNVAEFWGIKQQSTLLAYVLFSPRKKWCWLYSIAVASSAQGRGYASALLAKAEQRSKARGCQRIYLQVASNNKAAIKLYEKQNYRFHGSKKHYYANGETALLYVKDLHV